MPDSSEATPLAARLEALFRQGEAVLGAEMAYQKARVGFGWSRGKRVAIYLLLAGAFGGLTLVALVVGLLIALAPLLTAWGRWRWSAWASCCSAACASAPPCALFAMRAIRCWVSPPGQKRQWLLP